MISEDVTINGLTDEEVAESRQRYGANKLLVKRKNWLLDISGKLAGEPMLILLLVTATIYFVTGNTGDGIFMSFAIVLVSAISLYQETRSNNALKKIKDLTQPACKVFRNGKIISIATEDLVIGDSFIVEEGNLIPADGTIVQANDFSVNESVITGESLTRYKSEKISDDRAVYQGTIVSNGLAVAVVTAIGNETRLGKIGESVTKIISEKTPLERQINNFVQKMVVAGAIVFLIVWVINYMGTRDVADSLLKALTLAMSILPEEIPVAFTTFMALGSWRLMKMGLIVKQMKTVETLGSATVICTDKTGTLTENRMSLAKLYVLASDQFFDPATEPDETVKELIRYSMWASEPIPYDPMEIAIGRLYTSAVHPDERTLFKMVHEYPLGGTPPMMTHVFKNTSGERIIAAKGAPEALIDVSQLNEAEERLVRGAMDSLSSKGYRILGVGAGVLEGDSYPESQQDVKFVLKGILAFYDPPKENIPEVLKAFYQAGISVKIITGDNAATTTALARQIGFRAYENHLTGEALMKLTPSELQREVSAVNIFSRVFPESKLAVINALKGNNEIVAMTGDGVNDGPALKAAHIGIAMGKKGTEIAREAASLILLEDDLSKMVDAVAMGRKIYSNLKKAIQYIISIHIPIILTVLIPLLLGWIYPNIFSPVHVIFLELIMGPTCSLIYENEPIEQNAMQLPPRPFRKTFFNVKELTTSIVQGLAIATGSLLVYQYAVGQGYTEDGTRTMVFISLISSNIFLTLVNRSFYYSILQTLRNKNNLIPLIIVVTLLISGLLLYIPFLRELFGFIQPDASQLLLSLFVGFLSVIWYEVVKWIKRRGGEHNTPVAD